MDNDVNAAIRATGGGFKTTYDPMATAGGRRRKDTRIVETHHESGRYHVVVDGNQLTTEEISYDEATQIVDDLDS